MTVQNNKNQKQNANESETKMHVNTDAVFELSLFSHTLIISLNTTTQHCLESIWPQQTCKQTVGGF